MKKERLIQELSQPDDAVNANECLRPPGWPLWWPASATFLREKKTANEPTPSPSATDDIDVVGCTEREVRSRLGPDESFNEDSGESPPESGKSPPVPLPAEAVDALFAIVSGALPTSQKTAGNQQGRQ